MKKTLLIVLPGLLLLLIAGLAVSRPEKEAPMAPLLAKHWSYAFGGYRLGLNLSTLDPAIRKNLKIDGGLLVEEVLDNSPAEKAGIKEGDILLKLDGKNVEDVGDIREKLDDLDKAQPMEVELLRNSEHLKLTVTPEKRDLNIMLAGMHGNYIGVELQGLDGDLASYFQADAGVLVARVENDSPAKQAGIRSGDVITQFNGEKVDSADDVRRMLDKLDGQQSADLTVLRHGKSMKVTVKPEQRGLRMMDHMPEIPRIPDLRQLRELPDSKEMDDLREEIDRLKDEMKALGDEMRELKKSNND
jgi:C-terminal processing protease CtpA/Prc